MALNIAKHIIEEIDNVRCTIVEKDVSPDRMNFLKNILEASGLDVKVKKTEPESETYVVGVADVTFNPIIAIYQHALRTPEGDIVTPAYWNRLEKTIKDKYYWE